MLDPNPFSSVLDNDDSQDYLEQEFRPIYQRWKEKQDKKTNTELLQSLDPVINSALRSYANTNSPTLKSRAKLLALDAVKSYDPKKAKLRTHLMTQLQGLRRASQQETQLVRIPERVGLDLYRLNRAENEFRDQFGRDPSDAELSREAGISLKRLAHIRKAAPATSESTMDRLFESEEGNNAMSHGVIDDDQSAWVQFVYQDLSPVDQQVMQYAFGLYGQRRLPKQKIAEKLGISPSALSQRLAKIQAKLNVRDELNLQLL